MVLDFYINRRFGALAGFASGSLSYCAYCR